MKKYNFRGGKMKINRIGTYYKGKKSENGGEIIEEFDNFNIELDNVGINAIAKIDKNGYYFNILAVYKNNRIYRGQRFHIKYINIVRDIIFEHYRQNNMVEWLKGE